ncbi:MAG: 5'/3'-nucleotidase SurE [Acidimicrobiia bacterium]|nr:5'/3'-nucleotidase SurE [Acidimicrobiia bacterium]
MRLLLTNDDGIDSVGLHVLARAMKPFGEVLVIAPDREQSGAGAAVGPLHLLEPEVHECSLEGIRTAYMVSGTPALCVFLARLGAFGPPPDLVVSGINPGSNVGRAIYHSGTVGAALTARNGLISGVAVSQAVPDLGLEGQGAEAGRDLQLWDVAAEVAAQVVAGLLDRPPGAPLVGNVNVPNLPLHEIKGWREAEVGVVPPRAMGRARLEALEGRTGSFRAVMEPGEAQEIPPHLDGGVVSDGYVSISWLSRMVHEPVPMPAVADRLNALLPT